LLASVPPHCVTDKGQMLLITVGEESIAELGGIGYLGFCRVKTG
jgi:hypothetical protein